MSNSKITFANRIFSDICDGYTVDRLSSQISHSDQDVSFKMAQDAVQSFHKPVDSQTDQDADNMILVLDWILDGYTTDDLSSDHGLDFDTAQSYLDFISANRVSA